MSHVTYKIVCAIQKGEELAGTAPQTKIEHVLKLSTLFFGKWCKKASLKKLTEKLENDIKIPVGKRVLELLVWLIEVPPDLLTE